MLAPYRRSAPIAHRSPRASLALRSLSAIVGLGIGMGPACSPDATEIQGRCRDDEATILARAATLPDWPAPRAPGLEGPAVLARASGVSFLLDPDPSTRGEHPVSVIDVLPDCRLAASTLAALPIEAQPATDGALGAVDIDVTRAALLVSGPDPGAARDASHWHTIFTALDVRARHLAAPSRAAVEAALTSVCGAVEARGLLILVLAGAGTPGDGGAFVLSTLIGDDATREALPYHRIDVLLSERCAHLGAVIWVVDASHFALQARVGDAPSLIAVGPPVRVLRASDRVAPDAARASRLGPGLLGEVLAQRVPAARAGLCAPGRLENAEITAILSELAATPPGGVSPLRAALLEARWQGFGAPAIALLEASGMLTPNTSEQLKAALGSAIPIEPMIARGALPGGERCERASDCATCERGACERLACVAGLCRARPDPGAECDDGDDCTRADACVAGVCRGELVSCDDGNPCTDEACEPGRGCVAQARPGRGCDDDDACTEGDACTERGACVGASRVCDDGDPCTVDSCEGPSAGAPDGGCLFIARNLPCDDGDPCTLADQCRSQVCAGTRMTCSDGNDCTTDRCDPGTGQCRFDPVAQLAICDDGDPCTTLDRCRDGACRGIAASCDDALACTFDRCEDGHCKHLPAPGLCLSPSGASCVPVGASPPELPCLSCAATDRLVPMSDGAPCASDGIACTVDVCVAGECVHRDTPETCHHLGRCVTRGELLTDCLVCEGGGVVSAVDADTPCEGALGCQGGRCDGLGSCVCGGGP